MRYRAALHPETILLFFEGVITGFEPVTLPMSRRDALPGCATSRKFDWLSVIAILNNWLKTNKLICNHPLT